MCMILDIPYKKSPKEFHIGGSPHMIAFRPGGEWARYDDQMGELDNYTYSESSDHLDKGKQIFFINFGATSFLRQFSKGSEKCYAA